MLQNGASLSDDEATALAEQLAEAKHEEAQAEEADDLPESARSSRRTVRRSGGTRSPLARRAERRSQKPTTAEADATRRMPCTTKHSLAAEASPGRNPYGREGHGCGL